jgi:predicted nucleic acid-binding protein
MICLDTNYLIRALIPGTPDAARVAAWIASGEIIILPAVAWYEFLCGCTDEEEELALALLRRQRGEDFCPHLSLPKNSAAFACRCHDRRDGHSRKRPPRHQ